MGKKPVIPAQQTKISSGMVNMIKQCWATCPSDRPMLAEVIEVLWQEVRIWQQQLHHLTRCE